MKKQLLFAIALVCGGQSFPKKYVPKYATHPACPRAYGNPLAILPYGDQICVCTATQDSSGNLSLNCVAYVSIGQANKYSELQNSISITTSDISTSLYNRIKKAGSNGVVIQLDDLNGSLNIENDKVVFIPNKK